MRTSLEKLQEKLKSPFQVQNYLKNLTYNPGKTLTSAEFTARKKSAHCFEAAMLAAAILEVHEHPPLVMSLESIDLLDHVVYVFQENGRWGAIGRSREEGLQGRAPVFRSLRDLAWSYHDPYIDDTGRIKSYQIAHLDETCCDWRYSSRNVWKAENYLLDLKHVPLKSSEKRYRRLVQNFFKRGPLPRHDHWW